MELGDVILRRTLHVTNLPRVVCNHVFGKEHTHRHRMTMGSFVMVTGVYIASAGAEVHIFAIHFMADVIGYLLHGAGAIPFVDWLMVIGEEKYEHG